eukprot:2163931-Prymnesium_polylepis.2
MRQPPAGQWPETVATVARRLMYSPSQSSCAREPTPGAGREHERPSPSARPQRARFVSCRRAPFHPRTLSASDGALAL